jgi:hypothetical protein
MNPTATTITAEDWATLRCGDQLGVKGRPYFTIKTPPSSHRGCATVCDRTRRHTDTLRLTEDGRILIGTDEKFLQPIDVRKPGLHIIRRPNTPREDAEIRWKMQITAEGQTPITLDEWNGLERNDRIHVAVGKCTTHPTSNREEIWHVLYRDEDGYLWLKLRGWRRYPFTWKNGKIICHSTECLSPFNRPKVFIWKDGIPNP